MRSLLKNTISLLLSLKLWKVAAGAQEAKGSFGHLVRRDLADSQAITLRRGAYACAIAKFLSRSLYYLYYYLRLITCKTLFEGSLGEFNFYITFFFSTLNRC